MKNASDLKCSKCGNAGRIGRSSIDQYLDDVEYFVSNFNVQQGGKGGTFFNWMRGWTENGPVTNIQNLSNQLDEVHQTIRDFAKRGIKESEVRGMGQAFDLGKPGAALKEYDLRRINNIYTEYKNVDFASNHLINQTQSVDQFINGYLRNIESFDKFEWKAGYDKLKNAWGTQTEALIKMKSQWKAVFEAKSDEIFNTNPSLFNKLRLKDGTLVTDSELFGEFLEEATETDKLFDFVKVE